MTDRDALIHAISFALTRCRAYFCALVKNPPHRRRPRRRGRDHRRPNRAIGPGGAAEAAQARPQHAVSRWALVIWACLAAALPAAAGERLAGRAHVLDGDTIVVDGIHVRLK